MCERRSGGGLAFDRLYGGRAGGYHRGMTAIISHSIPRAALITGGARRLGRAIALALAHQGFDIAIHYGGSVEAAEDTRRQIEALGRRAVVLQADLMDEAAVEGLIPAAVERLGPVGVLV